MFCFPHPTEEWTGLLWKKFPQRKVVVVSDFVVRTTQNYNLFHFFRKLVSELVCQWLIQWWKRLLIVLLRILKSMSFEKLNYKPLILFFFINGQTNIVAYRPFEENYERRVSLTSTDRRIDQPSNERTGFIGKLHVSPSVQPIFRLTNFVGTGSLLIITLAWRHCRTDFSSPSSS